MSIARFLLIQVFLATAAFGQVTQVDRILQHTERMEVYRRMVDTFERICLPGGQFAQGVTFGNQLISPNLGVLNCNLQLGALNSMRLALRREAEDIAGADQEALCGDGPLDPLGGEVRGDIETALGASQILQGNQCTFNPGREFQCQSAVACIMVGGVRELSSASQALNCQGGGLEPCLSSFITGAFSSLRSAAEFAGAAVGYVADKGSAVYDSAYAAGTRAALRRDVGDAAADRFVSQRRIITEADEAAWNAIVNFVNLPFNEKVQRVRSMAAAIWDGISQSLRENSACRRWSGTPFRSSCLEAAPDLCSTTCGERSTMLCQVIGAIGGEILVEAITGGAAGVASLASRRVFRAAARDRTGGEPPGEGPYQDRVRRLRTILASGGAATAATIRSALRALGQNLRHIEQLPIVRQLQNASDELDRLPVRERLRDRQIFARLELNTDVKDYLELSELMSDMGRGASNGPDFSFGSSHRYMLASAEGIINSQFRPSGEALQALGYDATRHTLVQVRFNNIRRGVRSDVPVTGFTWFDSTPVTVQTTDLITSGAPSTPAPPLPRPRGRSRQPAAARAAPPPPPPTPEPPLRRTVEIPPARDGYTETGGVLSRTTGDSTEYIFPNGSSEIVTPTTRTIFYPDGNREVRNLSDNSSIIYDPNGVPVTRVDASGSPTAIEPEEAAALLAAGGNRNPQGPPAAQRVEQPDAALVARVEPDGPAGRLARPLLTQADALQGPAPALRRATDRQGDRTPDETPRSTECQNQPAIPPETEAERAQRALETEEMRGLERRVEDMYRAYRANTIEKREILIDIFTSEDPKVGSFRGQYASFRTDANGRLEPTFQGLRRGVPDNTRDFSREQAIRAEYPELERTVRSPERRAEFVEFRRDMTRLRDLRILRGNRLAQREFQSLRRNNCEADSPEEDGGRTAEGLCAALAKLHPGSYPSRGGQCRRIRFNSGASGRYCSCGMKDKTKFEWLTPCPGQSPDAEFQSEQEYRDTLALPASSTPEICSRVDIPAGKECYLGPTSATFAGFGGVTQLLCMDGPAGNPEDMDPLVREYRIEQRGRSDGNGNYDGSNLALRPVQWSPFATFPEFQQLVGAAAVCGLRCSDEEMARIRSQYENAVRTIEQRLAAGGSAAERARFALERSLFDPDYLTDLQRGRRPYRCMPREEGGSMPPECRYGPRDPLPAHLR